MGYDTRRMANSSNDKMTRKSNLTKIESNNNEPLVIVVIPVFNTARHLNGCISSVLKQTYKKIKIVIVDDGSSDGSEKICDYYAGDDRVIVFHQKNLGQSIARNKALHYIENNYKNINHYIGFVDSDDSIAVDMYETLINLIKRYNCDGAQIGIKTIDIENKIINNSNSKKSIINVYYGKDILQNYAVSTTKRDGYSLCRCLFKSNILEGIRFREKKVNEDIDYKYKALKNCNAFVISNEHKYYYLKSKKSTTAGALKKKDFDLYDAAKEMYELTKEENYGSIKKMFIIKKARTPLSLLCRIAYYGIDDETINKNELINELLAELRINAKTLLLAPLPLSRKVLLVLFLINFPFAEKVIATIKKIGISWI